MWDRGCAGAAGKSDLLESPRRTYWGFALVAFAFVALVGAELALIITIPGGNYGGADGKAAQAEILATLEFARAFDISNLNPLQGMGSQMMPMNVWVNPAYWPFALFDKELAAEISGVVALVCYAVACYVMARCFDLPRLPSIVAAQLSVMLFGPAVVALALYGRLRFDSRTGSCLCTTPAGLWLARTTFARSAASVHHCRRHIRAAVL